MNRVLVIVLDSVGVGELPDAHLYGDTGSNTLKNLARAIGGLNVPNLESLGLGNIIDVMGVDRLATPLGAYAKMAEKSSGKDTTTGHWELAGQIVSEPFPTYPNGFPDEVLNEFKLRIGRGILGNIAASGTEIIEMLGKEHLETGKPIVYTSADSVLQIAAHEEIIPLETLYEYCQIARDILKPPHGVGRVIARPFLGSPGSFVRTANRHDFSLEPPYPMLLDILKEAGLEVFGIGKIKDIYAGRGLTQTIATISNLDGINKTIEALANVKKGLIFTNLVEFDMKYGHRNNPRGYADSLEEFDRELPKILVKLGKDDILIITADHGCDPTMAGTDHTREYVPLIIYGSQVKALSLGIRDTFADVAATITSLLGTNAPPNGTDMSKDFFIK
ncbi:MAG: phosphopentomutase [Desulfitibacter sp. BRH_c19]|nr:MAG: phosphopentomutase [Desulfitibacter sp. BRH_c19]